MIKNMLIMCMQSEVSHVAENMRKQPILRLN